MTKETSPFAKDCAEYIERGLSVIPIAPGKKFPGTFDGHKWQPARGWSEMGKRLMSVEEIEAAETWPDAGIALCPGEFSGVIALDWDYDGGVKEILEAITPRSPVKKIGSKGYTSFYRFNGETTGRWSVGGERVLELLSTGTQTVMPGSIHPETGKPYYWDTLDTLLDIDLEDLPKLPDDYADQVARALKPYTATASGTSGRDRGDEVDPDTLPQQDIDELCKALNLVPADDREVWVRMGMALKCIGEPGFNIWHNWSRTSDKYDEAAHNGMQGRWDGFKILANGICYRDIFSEAIKYGYKPRPAIKPGVTGNMAIAAMEHAIRTGIIPHPAEAEFSEAFTPEKSVKTGQRLLSYAELGKMAPPDWLIKDIQIMDSLAMTYGASGSGKSFHDVDKALHVAAGKAWHGRKVRPGTVIYVVGEGRAGILKRVNAWCTHHAFDPNKLDFLVTAQAVPFLDPIAVHTLAELIHNLPENPVYIIVDTLNRNFGDGDENSTRDMSAFIDALDELRVNTGACIEVVHHTGKAEGGTARGSSALRAALDTEIAIVAAASGLKITCTKQKDAEPFEPIHFKYKTIEVARSAEGEPIESLVCVLDHEAVKNKENKAAMLRDAAEKVTGNKKVLLEKLRSITNTRKHNRPDLDRIIIERPELHEELKASIPSKTTRNDQFNWALEIGVLVADGLIFDVDTEVLRELIA